MRWPLTLVVSWLISIIAALVIENANPTRVVLSHGTITLRIRWHATDEEGFQFAFRLEPSGTRSGRPRSTPLVASFDSTISEVMFRGVSPGTYELHAIELFDSDSPGDGIDDGTPISIQVKAETTVTETGPTITPITTSDFTASTISPISSASPTSPSLVTVTIISTESTGLQAQSNHDVGRIAGSVVGAVLLVFTTISIIFYRRRKTRNSRTSKELPVISPYPNIVTPAFAVGRKQHKQAHQQDIVVDAQFTTESRDGNTQLHSADRNNVQEVVESPTAPREEALIKYHDDSGWRPRRVSSLPPIFGTGNPTVIEIPPRYDAAS
ncbi:hypothetical protein VNI00_018166 [Paramarasmius palmivorus]|uniref:Uncharacterized protein n=1 Tax=Paramarasmius palmivorus TaxID=297713 RepID=A0AAW0B287_9AGAR